MEITKSGILEIDYNKEINDEVRETVALRLMLTGRQLISYLGNLYSADFKNGYDRTMCLGALALQKPLLKELVVVWTTSGLGDGYIALKFLRQAIAVDSLHKEEYYK